MRLGRRRHRWHGSGGKLVGLGLGLFGLFLMARTLPVGVWMAALGIGLFILGWIVYLND